LKGIEDFNLEHMTKGGGVWKTMITMLELKIVIASLIDSSIRIKDLELF
jgi:hypothetical protein